MSRVSSWLCFSNVWCSASGQKLFFLWGGNLRRGRQIKVAAPCVATTSAEIWWCGAEDGGKAVIKPVKLLPTHPDVKDGHKYHLGLILKSETRWAAGNDRSWQLRKLTKGSSVMPHVSKLCAGWDPWGAQLGWGGVHLETSRSFLHGSPHKPWDSAQHDRWLHNPQVPRGHPSEPEESEKVKLLSRVQLLATPWTVTYIWLLQHEIFQARMLEWVAISFSRAVVVGSSPKARKVMLCVYMSHTHTHTHTHTHIHTGIYRGTYLFLSSFSHPAVSDSWQSHGL